MLIGNFGVAKPYVLFTFYVFEGFPQTPFTYHPVMMTVAFVLFMTQGVVCYVSDYGEVVSYIT